MIHIENIVFSYDKEETINNLSLTVNNGDWLGLVGPNGSGKTTLIKLISGYIKPTEGNIEIDGKDINRYRRKQFARKVAVVPQVSNYLFQFNALEIVLMGRASYLKRFGFESKSDLLIAEDVMKLTDTWQFRARSIEELSGGERQRVFVARALAQEPKVLLLDEPTTFLDIKHQMDIMELLAHLNSQTGMTIITAIHDVNLAISYCKEIALLSKGTIRSQGRPEDVITYANLKRIFNTEVYVGINQFSNMPYYIPMKRDSIENR